MRMTLLALVGGLVFGIGSPAPSAAQSSADSRQVAIAAVEALLGSPPYAHPAGSAKVVCLDATARITGWDAWRQRLADHIEAQLGASVEQGCTVARGVPSMVISSETGAPALILRLEALRFPVPGEARAGISVITGRRAGRSYECTVRRRDRAGWEATECELLELF